MSVELEMAYHTVRGCIVDFEGHVRNVLSELDTALEPFMESDDDLTVRVPGAPFSLEWYRPYYTVELYKHNVHEHCKCCDGSGEMIVAWTDGTKKKYVCSECHGNREMVVYDREEYQVFSVTLESVSVFNNNHIEVKFAYEVKSGKLTLGGKQVETFEWSDGKLYADYDLAVQECNACNDKLKAKAAASV
jgi:hypothetical protein